MASPLSLSRFAQVIDLDDAVALVKSNDTLCVSGFVTQSCPDMLLRALRYVSTSSLNNNGLEFSDHG